MIDRWHGLLQETTVDLVRRVVEDSDRLALEVLIETRKPYRFQGKSLALPDFLEKLRGYLTSTGGNDMQTLELADCAYDLTLAQFSHLPEAGGSVSEENAPSFIGTRTDCRNYYREFLRRMELVREEQPDMSRLLEEEQAGKTLRSLVSKSFKRSKLECYRRSRFSIRYTWEVNGGRLNLYYPSYLTAKEFRNWLEENVPDVDPMRMGEKKRIQARIDEQLGRGGWVHRDGDLASENGDPAGSEPSSGEEAEGLAFASDLSKAVSQKKDDEFESLRRAIRKLGREGVRKLVSSIFQALTEGNYELSATAREFGLSKASLSRFAGSRWFDKKTDSEKVEVPDLWRNTATVLASNAAFMEIVVESGFDVDLREILALTAPAKGGQKDE